MINFKKVGATALAGSLVAMSAYAGEMAVTGSANVTYKSGKKSVADQSSFGNDSDVTFTGTGELDNGWTFVMSVAGTDNLGAATSSYTSLTMGSMGTLTLGNHAGGAGGKYDEEVPQAYEQVSDALSTGSASSNLIGNQLDSGGIVWNSPSFDVAGVSLSVDAEFSPQGDDTSSGDGSQAAYSATTGKGYGLGLTAKYEGATFGVYGSEIDTRVEATSSTKARDSFEGVVYAKYSFGPVSVGASKSYIDSGKVTAGSISESGYLVRTAGGYFENDQMSIAYNVNDNLSVSYTNSKDTYSGVGLRNVLTGTDDALTVDQKTRAYQAAYSMGAMSIKAYNMVVKNPGYDSTSEELSVTEIALGLAF
jgi:outer membrane protein OmpU